MDLIADKDSLVVAKDGLPTPSQTVYSQLSPALQDLIKVLGIYFVEPDRLWEAGNATMSDSEGGIYSLINEAISVKTCAKGFSLTEMQDFYLLHEISHWTGHPKRLNRLAVRVALTCMVEGLSAEELHTEEATAELGMFKLAEVFELSMEKALAHCDAYLDKLKFADLHQAERDSDLIVEYILNQLDKVKGLR